MKKKTLLFLFLLTIITIFIPQNIALANDGKENTEKNLEEEIEDLISNLDLTEFEEYLKQIPQNLKSEASLGKQLIGLIKGEVDINFNDVSEYLLLLFFSGIKEKIPTFISLFVLLVICVIINTIKTDRLGGGVYEIARFACFSVVVCIVCAVSYSLVDEAKQTIERVSKVVQSIFPIMLSLMTVTGNVKSIAVYNPAVLFISDFVIIVVNKFIFPIILGMLAISVISNLCKTIKLNGLLNFSAGTLKWVIGLIATVFSLFLTVRGLNSGIYDGISIRALKYTINSSVPIVGGILRDGFDLILASGILVKNALGSIALIVIFGIVITPIVQIACVSLALKLVGAVLEPLNDQRTTAFLNSVCSVINFIIASVIIVSLMYVVIIIMAICSSQMIF